MTILCASVCECDCEYERVCHCWCVLTVSGLCLCANSRDLNPSESSLSLELSFTLWRVCVCVFVLQCERVMQRMMMMMMMANVRGCWWRFVCMKEQLRNSPVRRHSQKTNKNEHHSFQKIIMFFSCFTFSPQYQKTKDSLILNGNKTESYFNGSGSIFVVIFSIFKICKTIFRR